VTDTGPGVPDAERERIFEPFVTTKSDGTGLGLPLVRRILDGYGAGVRCEEAPEGGARFVLRLPRGGEDDV
jgi:signal transduction histidine kinase